MFTGWSAGEMPLMFTVGAGVDRSAKGVAEFLLTYSMQESNPPRVCKMALFFKIDLFLPKIFVDSTSCLHILWLKLDKSGTKELLPNHTITYPVRVNHLDWNHDDSWGRGRSRVRRWGRLRDRQRQRPHRRRRFVHLRGDGDGRHGDGRHRARRNGPYTSLKISLG